MKNLKSQKGFTLIEILVVLAIVAMLSTLAVNGYLSYRRSALLDLGADNLISEINSMRAKATYGSSTNAKFQEIKSKLDGKNVSSVAENDPKCYGIFFEKNADNFELSSFVSTFSNKKIWKNQTWEYQGCESVQMAKGKDKLSSDAQMKIAEISDDKGAKYSKLVVRFLPPDGKLEAVNVIDPAHPVVLKNAEKLKILVRYGTDVKSEYQREVILDLTNSNFYVQEN